MSERYEQTSLDLDDEQRHGSADSSRPIAATRRLLSSEEKGAHYSQERLGLGLSPQPGDYYDDATEQWCQFTDQETADGRKGIEECRRVLGVYPRQGAEMSSQHTGKRPADTGSNKPPRRPASPRRSAQEHNT